MNFVCDQTYICTMYVRLNYTNCSRWQCYCLWYAPFGSCIYWKWFTIKRMLDLQPRRITKIEFFLFTSSSIFVRRVGSSPFETFGPFTLLTAQNDYYFVRFHLYGNEFCAVECPAWRINRRVQWPEDHQFIWNFFSSFFRFTSSCLAHHL